MPSSWLALALVLMSMAVGCSAQTRGDVLDGLPDPDAEAIGKIRDAQQWRNPYVIVNRDGYELILPDRPRTTERSNLAALEDALLKLPRERWPLGRVVAVQENSIRAIGDDEGIATNLIALKRMLESYKVRIDLWPA